MIDFIKRHSLASYVALTMAISWGGILLIVLPTALPAPEAEAQRLFTAVYLAMLAGPTIAGPTITAIARGRDGLRDYRVRLMTWRVDVRWYLVALLTAPVAIGLTLCVLTRLSVDFTPGIFSGSASTAGLLPAQGVAAFVLTGHAIGIGAGFFEELGWTGIATPHLLDRRGLTMTGLGVGVVWGVWHFLAIYWGSANAVGSVPTWAYLLVVLFSFLVPYRILMTWVFLHTRSMIVAILMHASLTASMLILGPSVSGYDLLWYDLTLGAVLWVGVIVVSRRYAGQPFQQRPVPGSMMHT